MFLTKKIDNTIFITFFTILLLYREKITGVIQQVPDFIEFYGRSQTVMKILKDIHIDYLKIKNTE